jgi:hypothetical protein
MIFAAINLDCMGVTTVNIHEYKFFTVSATKS